jgi:hypothetical protein
MGSSTLIMGGYDIKLRWMSHKETVICHTCHFGHVCKNLPPAFFFLGFFDTLSTALLHPSSSYRFSQHEDHRYGQTALALLLYDFRTLLQGTWAMNDDSALILP